MPAKPVPTEMKRLRGNPGKRALPKKGQEPVPSMSKEMPSPPEWLGEYGEKEWWRVGPILIDTHLLTDADYMAFTAYCQNVQLLAESSIAIAEKGMTIFGARGPVRNPALATFAAATTSLRALAAEFGMTPSSRARIKLPGDDGETLDDLIGTADGEDAE
jgi:P27 family predicted phage terminase small subunit